MSVATRGWMHEWDSRVYEWDSRKDLGSKVDRLLVAMKRSSGRAGEASGRAHEVTS